MAEKIDRRRFLKTSVGAAVGAVVAAHLPAGAAEKKSKTPRGAEKIFRGGIIITMDARHRQVEAVAIAGGHILAADDEAAVLKTHVKKHKIKKGAWIIGYGYDRSNRAKGFVRLRSDPGRRYVYQQVGARWSLEAGEAWGEEPRRSRIVVIGRKRAASAEALGTLLDKVPSGRPTQTYRPLYVTIKEKRPMKTGRLSYGVSAHSKG